jgi:hypothetical protein
MEQEGEIGQTKVILTKQDKTDFRCGHERVDSFNTSFLFVFRGSSTNQTISVKDDEKGMPDR